MTGADQLRLSDAESGNPDRAGAGGAGRIPGSRLKPGMYATFRFAARDGPVLSVPRSAILSTGKRDLVFRPPWRTDR